jgi:hypothetical protein
MGCKELESRVFDQNELQETLKDLQAKEKAMDTKVEKRTFINVALNDNVAVLKEVRDRRAALEVWCKERGGPKNMSAEDHQSTESA